MVEIYIFPLHNWQFQIPPLPEISVRVCHGFSQSPPSPSNGTYLLNGPYTTNNTIIYVSTQKDFDANLNMNLGTF